jgi:hypothetical protein
LHVRGWLLHRCVSAKDVAGTQTARQQRLAAGGHDVCGAWKLLALFDDIQAEMVGHHRTLVRDMDARNARKRATWWRT